MNTANYSPLCQNVANSTPRKWGIHSARRLDTIGQWGSHDHDLRHDLWQPFIRYREPRIRVRDMFRSALVEGGGMGRWAHAVPAVPCSPTSTVIRTRHGVRRRGLRLLPGREVPAFVEPVVMNQFGIRSLPNSVGLYRSHLGGRGEFRHCFVP